MEQGRQASGRRDLRRVPRGARCVVKCSQKPSRGARTLRTAPAGDRQSLAHRAASRRSAANGAPGVVVFVGARTRRGGSRTRETHRSPSSSEDGGRGGEGERAACKRSNSEGEPNSTRGSLGTLRPGSPHDGKDPRPVETARGERQEPRKRYPSGSRTLKETVTSREAGRGAGDCATDTAGFAQSLGW